MSKLAAASAVEFELETRAVSVFRWLKEHILAEVVGAIVLAAGASLAGWIWPQLLTPAVDFFGWLVADVRVYRFWYWTLTLYLVSTLVLATCLMVRGMIEQSAQVSDYTSDLIFGVLWTWRWSSFDQSVMSLNPLCPRCKRKLETDWGRSGYSNSEYRTELRCRQDGVIFSGKEEPHKLRIVVEDEIYTKCRTGDWVKVVESQRNKEAIGQ